MRIVIVLAVMKLSACVEPTESDGFVGTWVVTGGTVTVMCGPTTMVAPESANVKLELGTDSDLVQHRGGTPPCDIKYSVSANVASVLPDQSCSGMVTSGATVVTTFDMSTYMLIDDETMTREGSGTATSTPAGGGAPVPCTYSSDAAYRRE